MCARTAGRPAARFKGVRFTIKMTEVEAIKSLISRWYEAKSWAENLLCEHLELESPEDILDSEHRGRKKIGDTEWYSRTHGVGVDVCKPNNKGGIDFDFDKPDPDEWRLREFLIKQLNDGNLVKKNYKKFLQDDGLWKKTYEKAIQET